MKTRQEISNFMEKLVWSRFSKKSLDKKLSEFFEQTVVTYRNDLDLDHKLSDYRYGFTIETDDTEWDFEIYFLKMKNKSEDDGSNIYITEVCCMF